MAAIGQKQIPRFASHFLIRKMRFLSVLVISCLLLAGCSDRGGYFLEVDSGSTSHNSPPDASHVALPLEVDLDVAEQFVRIGYRLDQQQRFQSTEFLTPRLRTSQAAQLIRLVKQYNNFEGEKVASAVSDLQGRVSGVEFGRERSPVLYVELPHWTHQREETKGPGVKIGTAENDKLVAELRIVFLDQLKADEFSVQDRRVRVWWD